MINILNAFKLKDYVKKAGSNYNALLLFSFVIIAYLVMNTGIVSDDFEAMALLKGKDFREIIIPHGKFYFIETPVQYFSQFIFYHFFRIDNSFFDSLFKMIYIYLSFYLISQFFKIYVDRCTALLISFLFIFFPSHDSTVYCFMIQSLTLSFAFYFYSFYLAHRNKLFFALLFSFTASFISYGSPAIAIALCLLFILDKEFKKGMIIFIPNIFYIIYYILLTKGFGIGIDKLALTKEINIWSVAKLFILQILSFTDAVVGPSMWLKIYYAFSQLSVTSFIIGTLLTIIFYKTIQKQKNKINLKLVICLLILSLSSFMMFAITGWYPQLAFNLGNRTTVFGSLLFAYLIILFTVPKKIKTLIFSLLIFTILGISDHWKNWNMHQQKVIYNIGNNPQLKKYSDKMMIYVSGNQYSKYGPISHIEFLSEGWVVNPIFYLAIGRKVATVPLNKRYRLIDGYLIDKKYDWKEQVSGYINVYDSEKDAFFKVDTGDINAYIFALPADNRHWIEMYDNKIINNLIIKLMPRLKYAL